MLIAESLHYMVPIWNKLSSNSEHPDGLPEGIKGHVCNLTVQQLKVCACAPIFILDYQRVLCLCQV